MEACQVAMEAERLKNKELLTSMCDVLYQKIDNMLQAVNLVLADPDAMHTAPSLRVERETLVNTQARMFKVERNQQELSALVTESEVGQQDPGSISL